jgi:histone H3/H4
MPKTKRRRSGKWSAIRDIRKFQNRGKFATKTLVPKSCFNRVARGIALDTTHKSLRFREDAVESLQEATEAYVTYLFKQSNKICTAQGRMTLQAGDMRLAHSILNNTNVDLTADPPAADAEEEQDADTEDADTEQDEETWVQV